MKSHFDLFWFVIILAVVTAAGYYIAMLRTQVYYLENGLVKCVLVEQNGKTQDRLPTAKEPK